MITNQQVALERYIPEWVDDVLDEMELKYHSVQISTYDPLLKVVQITVNLKSNNNNYFEYEVMVYKDINIVNMLNEMQRYTKIALLVEHTFSNGAVLTKTKNT